MLFSLQKQQLFLAFHLRGHLFVGIKKKEIILFLGSERLGSHVLLRHSYLAIMYHPSHSLFFHLLDDDGYSQFVLRNK